MAFIKESLNVGQQLGRRQVLLKRRPKMQNRCAVWRFFLETLGTVSIADHHKIGLSVDVLVIFTPLSAFPTCLLLMHLFVRPAEKRSLRRDGGRSHRRRLRLFPGILVESSAPGSPSLMTKAVTTTLQRRKRRVDFLTSWRRRRRRSQTVKKKKKKRRKMKWSLIPDLEGRKEGEEERANKRRLVWG